MQSETLITSTFQQLRRDIVAGELEPGERLGVERLKQRYGVGASTIREALSLLSAESLVVAEGQRGFIVSPISIDDLRDLCDARILIECHALRESMRRGGDEWEGELLAAFHLLTRAQGRLQENGEHAIAEWELRNREFHEVLTSGCGSRWIRDMLATLYYHMERYRRISLTGGTVKRDVHGEFADLMQAVLDHDADRAVAILEGHIRRTVELIAAGQAS